MRWNRKTSVLLLLSLYTGAIQGSAWAQSATPPPASPPSTRLAPTLVHLDTPDALPRHVFVGQLGLRAFGGDEDVSYFSMMAQMGLGDGWGVMVRATTGSKKSFTLSDGDIRHGGTDIEVVGKYTFPQALDSSGSITSAVLVGVAFPQTPAQSGDAIPTLGLSGSAVVSDRVTLFLNPRAVFIKDNILYGLGIGAEVRLTNGLALIGDVTPIRGDNTRRTDDGSTESKAVYGVALRVTPRPRPDGSGFSLDIGYANGTGVTTGFAMTPGLNNSGSIYASLTYRH